MLRLGQAAVTRICYAFSKSVSESIVVALITGSCVIVAAAISKVDTIIPLFKKGKSSRLKI